MAQPEPPVFRSAPEIERAIMRALQLWPQITTSPLSLRAGAEPTSLPAVYAFAAQTVTLAESVLTLYRAGQSFAAVTLIRSSMECAITAAWLSVAPEQTRSLLQHGAVERQKALRDLERLTTVDVAEARREVEALLKQLEGDRSEPGRVMKSRFEALEGGDVLHITYRVLSQLAHPTPLLVDEWVETAERSVDNPLGLALRDAPDYSDSRRTANLGVQLCMLVVAENALDSLLAKPRVNTQLTDLAQQIGISPTITRR